MKRETEGAVSAVTMGGHRIGPGERTFIVAEAGVNHDGSFETALRMVDAAVGAGADAVKFQAFHAADLVSAGACTAAYQRKGSNETSQRSMLSRLELSPSDLSRIKQHCDDRSILFLATPFGTRELACLVELGVGAIKIASTDLTNSPLLDAVAATQLPTLLSTGASTEEEIREAVEGFRSGWAGRRLLLLHCVSCYPTPVEAVNLRVIRTLEQTYALPCGLSDHTLSTHVGAWAVAAGACVLEKHFTLDAYAAGPDHAVSLMPTALAEYIALVRRVESALGDGRPGLTEGEREVRAVARKSVVAAMDIPAGTVLTGEMLTLKRPGTGIAPRDLARLHGRRVRFDIDCDTLLSWDMIR